MALTKADILARTDLPREKVAVPEWGGDCWVRTLTGWERDQYEAGSMKYEDGEASPVLHNARGRLAVMVLCDESGVRLFSDDDAQDLGRRSVKALDRVLAVAKKLNGLDGDSQERAEGNSPPAPGGGSSSTSPGTSA